MAKRSQAVFVAVLMSMGLLTLLVYGARGEAVPLEAPGEGRQLSSVRHCKTDDLPSLPIPSLEWLTAQLPTPDELRPRFASVEELFRHVPFWHPVAAEDILPTADSAPKKDVLLARRCNAIVLALVTVSLGVALASLPVVLANRLTMMRYSRLASPNSNGEELPLSGKDAEPTAEPIEMELGPVRTMLFAAYYFAHNATLMVLASYSMTHNLMLGALGIDWEMLWLWLVGVLTADVISYTLRAVEAACHGRVLALPFADMVMSVLPVLGPRVDLLKDCLFAASAFELAACAEEQSTQHVGFVIGCLALLTIFLPAPFLFYTGHTRRDLAAEFLPAIVARATEPRESKGPGWCEWICSKAEELTSCWKREERAEGPPQDRQDHKQTWVGWMLPKAAPKMVAQCTDARLRTGLAEDLPQAVLALWAMFVFNKFSGLMLFSFVICAGKIAAVFLLRWFLRGTGFYLVDPVSCFTFLASYYSHLPTQKRVDVEDALGATPLHEAAGHGYVETVAALLAAGADKEARADSGGTPLHRAAAQGRPDVVKLLLEAGADKDVQSKTGFRPLDVVGGAHNATEGEKAACRRLLG